MALLRRLIVVVADAQIQGQPRHDPPIVLEVAGVVPAHVIDVEEVGYSGAVLLIGKEVGHTRAGKTLPWDGGVEAGVVVAAVRVDRCGGREAHMLEGHASLEGVVPSNFGHVVQNLEDVLVFDRRIETRRAEAADARDAGAGQTAIVLLEGDAAQPHGGRDILLRAGLKELKVPPVVAEAELIRQGLRELMGFAQCVVLAHVDGRSVGPITAAVENRTERRSIVAALVVVAHAEECLVVLGRIPIDTAIPLHCVVDVVVVHNVVVVGLAAVGVRQRIEIEEALRDGIDLIGTEHVRLAIAGQGGRAFRSRLVEQRRLARAGKPGIEQLAEVALSHQRGRHGVGAGLAEDDAVGFDVTEEKEVIFEDRAADGTPELVLPVLRLGLREVIHGVQHIIAPVLPQVAMQSIGAALDRGIDHAARRVTELRIVVAGLDFELCQCIGRRLYHEARAVQKVHCV